VGVYGGGLSIFSIAVNTFVQLYTGPDLLVKFGCIPESSGNATSYEKGFNPL
jgi:hypothetical protein